ncbi:hypothetical protein GOV03_01900 [Candidatus Woesearchaeota archaeon]|nr:hypothetical protein [Candidatus Woesearchaeota archaeon]
MHSEIVLEAIAEKVDVYEGMMSRHYFEAKIKKVIDADPAFQINYLRKELDYEDFSQIGVMLAQKGVLETVMRGEQLFYLKVGPYFL